MLCGEFKSIAGLRTIDANLTNLFDKIADVVAQVPNTKITNAIRLGKRTADRIIVIQTMSQQSFGTNRNNAEFKRKMAIVLAREFVGERTDVHLIEIGKIV